MRERKAGSNLSPALPTIIAQKDTAILKPRREPFLIPGRRDRLEVFPKWVTKRDLIVYPAFGLQDEVDRVACAQQKSHLEPLAIFTAHIEDFQTLPSGACAGSVLSRLTEPSHPEKMPGSALLDC
jgi:hypothetical protein